MAEGLLVDSSFEPLWNAFPKDYREEAEPPLLVARWMRADR